MSERPTRAGWARYAAIASAIVLVLAVVRQITNANDLTSSGTFGAFLRLSVPIGLAGLGGIFAERCGIVNIGLEGMMILGTWFGAYGGWRWGPWWGVLLGLTAGAIGGLVHAVATVNFGVNQIVSGVSINILAAGVARYLSVITYDAASGGGASQSPAIKSTIRKVSVPGFKTWFGDLEKKNWFVVSDLAGLIRGLTTDLSLLTIASVALVPLSAWVLWRTVFGLRLRSVGESPAAAESLGVNVYLQRYLGVMISGAFAGLAGAFLVMEAAGIYREGQTGGRGYIGIAAMIFGNWRPVGLALGAGLFGFTDALQLRSERAIHAVLLVVALGLALFAAYRVSTKARPHLPTIVFAITAALFWLWYALSDKVPNQFVTFTPHLTTLLVLTFASQRLRPPAAAGVPYRKGQAV